MAASSVGVLGSSQSQTLVPGELSHARVLVVDGDASARSVLEVALKRDGYEVFSVASGREALRLLGEGMAPSMVVLASDLQGEDGYSLCAQIRGDQRFSTLPVMLLARHADDERQALADVVGADELVPKPAFARDVSVLIRLRLMKRQSDGAMKIDATVVPLRQVLRAVLSAHKSGQILLAGGRGYLSFHEGKVIDAELDAEKGPEAVVRMLALSGGSYIVKALPLMADTRFELTLRELLTSVMPRLERWEQLAARSVPLEERFAVSFAALARALPTLPDAVNEVVKLFDGVRTVRDVLFDSPLNETVTLEVTNRLYLMAVIAPVQRSLQPTDELKDAPRLFEPRPSEAEEDMQRLFGSKTSNAIVTPLETPLVRVGDWYEPPHGSGLDAQDDNDWSVRQGPVTELLPPELPRPSSPPFISNQQVQLVVPDAAPVALHPTLEHQLNAFNVQSVIEEPTMPASHHELKAFSEGHASPDDVTIPIRLTEALDAAPTSTVAHQHQTLEDHFFAEHAEPALAVLPTSVAEAVLGPAYAELEEEAPEDEDESTSGRLWLIAAAAVVLIAGGALVAYRLADVAPVEVAPIAAAPVIVAAPGNDEPAEVVHLQAPELVVEEAPPPMIVSDELAAATKMYEAGKVKEAVAALERVVEVESSNTQAWTLLGLARYDASDVQGAKEAAATALALDPKAARAHLLLATVYIDQSKRSQAEQELKTYLELEPEGQFAQEAKWMLKR